MAKTCGSCAAFCALKNECRAKSPTPFLINGPEGAPVSVGVFPATRAEGWCAEWRHDAAHDHTGYEFVT
jgi:hypothetical protein